MRRRTFLLLGLTTLVCAGCKTNEEPALYRAQPYTPQQTSLDQMEADSTPDPLADYEAPAATVAADMEVTPSTESAGNESDELLVPVGGQVYTVQKGDTLYKLARRYYNDQSRWRDIWEANQMRLSDPDMLPVGIKLIIP